MQRKIRAEVQEPAEKIEKTSMTKNDLFEALSGTTVTKETAAKKDKMISLAPPANLQKKIDEIVKYKKEEKEAKAERESREVDVINWVQEKQDADGLSDNFQKSYRVKGDKEVITYVTSDSFSALTKEKFEALKEIFGSRYDEFLTSKRSIIVNPEVLQKPELQKELMTYIPKDRMQVFFVASEEFHTADGFDQKMFAFARKLSNPKKMLERIREYVSQRKPSLK